MTATQTQYQLRDMEAGDIPQVADIERECFPPPWPPTNFKRELSNQTARYIVACDLTLTAPLPGPVSAVPEHPGRASFMGRLKALVRPSPKEDAPQIPVRPVVGYTGLWLLVGEAHIITMAVRESRRGEGLGAFLLAAAIDIAAQEKATFVTLEVRVSNLVAQRLYHKYGFREVGIRRGYYTDNKEDAVLMSTDGITSASFQANLQQLKRDLARRWTAVDGASR